MKPTELTAELRAIAGRIERSKNPTRELVASDIKRVLSRLAQQQEEEDCEEAPPVAQQQEQSQQQTVTQQEQTALPKSKPGQQMVMEAIEDLSEAAQSGDEMAFKKALDQLHKVAQV